MDNHVIFALAEENREMSDIDRLVNLYWGLSGVLVAGVEGEVVELGCNVGKTSVFLRMVLDHFAPERTLHVYDSFEGLPPPGPFDAYLAEGECPATVEELYATCDRWNVARPVVHKGWFTETLPTRLPDQVCFAYLDGDFYDSISTSLEYLYDHLAPNAVVIIDDYCDKEKNPRAWDLLPGPKKACDEFFSDKPESVSVLVGSGDLGYGYFRKGWSGPPRDGRPR